MNESCLSLDRSLPDLSKTKNINGESSFESISLSESFDRFLAAQKNHNVFRDDFLNETFQNEKSEHRETLPDVSKYFIVIAFVLG